MKAAVLMVVLAAQDRQPLEWRFKKDDAFHVTARLRVRLEPDNWKEFAATLGETDISLTITARAVVRQTDVEGTGLLAVTFESTRLSGKYLGGQVDYVFERDKPLRNVVAESQPGRWLGEVIKDLTDITKRETEVVMDADGKAYVRGLLPQTIAQGLNRPQPFGLTLPRRGAAPGDSWTEETELLGKLFDRLDVKVKTRVTHTFESREGGIGTINTSEEGRREEKELTILVKGRATSRFDLQAGHLQSTRGAREFRFEFAVEKDKAAVRALVEYELTVDRK